MANTQMERCPNCEHDVKVHEPKGYGGCTFRIKLPDGGDDYCPCGFTDVQASTPAAPETAPPQTEEEFVLELAAIYGLDEFFMRALPVPTLEMWKMLVRKEAQRHKSERETMEKFRKELCDLKFGAETPRKEEA